MPTTREIEKMQQEQERIDKMYRKRAGKKIGINIIVSKESKAGKKSYLVADSIRVNRKKANKKCWRTAEKVGYED